MNGNISLSYTYFHLHLVRHTANFSSKATLRMIISTTLSPLLICLALSTLSCIATEQEERILTPCSRRPIPRRLLQDRLATVQTAGEDPEKHLFEIDENGFLRGPHVSVDLRTGARPILDKVHEESFTYRLNGKNVPSSEARAVVHEVGKFHVMYDDDGKISSVWSLNMFLEQLDSLKYPGVFLNVQKTPVSMDGDINNGDNHDSLVFLEDVQTRLKAELSSRKKRRNSRRVDIAIAYDNVLCGGFGNSASRTAQYVRRVVASSSKILKRELSVELRLSFIDGHCQDRNDPYDYFRILLFINPLDRSRYILNRFGNFWISKFGKVNRDVAYLFSGWTDGTNTGGAAFVRQACQKPAYGWVELGFQPVFIHEIGHSIGSAHTKTGIMRATYSRGDPLKFSSISKKQIAKYLSSARAKCIVKVK